MFATQLACLVQGRSALGSKWARCRRAVCIVILCWLSVQLYGVGGRVFEKALFLAWHDAEVWKAGICCDRLLGKSWMLWGDRDSMLIPLLVHCGWFGMLGLRLVVVESWSRDDRTRCMSLRPWGPWYKCSVIVVLLGLYAGRLGRVYGWYEWSGYSCTDVRAFR